MILVLAVPLLVLGGGLFLLLLTHTSSVHQGAAVNTNAGGGWWGAFKRSLILTNPIAVAIGTAIDKVFHAGRAWVSHWTQANLKPLARWFDGLTELNKRTYSQMAGLSTDTAESLHRMRHVVIPHAAAVAAKPAMTQAKHATSTATQALNRTHTLSSTVTREHRAQVKLNVRYSHAIDVTIPRQLGRIQTRQRATDTTVEGLRDAVQGFEHGAIDTFKWLNTHRTTAAFGVFTGAVAWALSRLGYGFLRCQSWRNLGRSMKCSDANILRDLLALAGGILATQISLADFIKFAQGVEGEAVGALHTFIRE